jgi:hypothetical protein
VSRKQAILRLKSFQWERVQQAKRAVHSHSPFEELNAASLGMAQCGVDFVDPVLSFKPYLNDEHATACDDITVDKIGLAEHDIAGGIIMTIS